MANHKREHVKCMRCGEVRKHYSRGLCASCSVYYAKQRAIGVERYSLAMMERDGLCLPSMRKAKVVKNDGGEGHCVSGGGGE